MDVNREARDGLLLGVGAYLLWGLLPLYLRLLDGVPSTQVLAHRILWSLLLIGALVLALRRAAAIRAAARGRTLAMLALSSLLIGINWFVYVWSIQHQHALEASLGYFINPLVNVALGVAVLGERIRPVQRVAVAIACIGVVLMAVANLAGGGEAWWIPITLALSFGSYGLVRKVVAIDALGGLTVETLILAPAALVWLLWCEGAGTAAWGQSARVDWLLVFTGAVTATPLLMFTAAARRLRYTTLGLLQYLAPTLVFFEAVLLFGEPLHPIRIVTFVLIWLGCALYAFDSIRAARAAVPSAE